jgi:SAM-dependent methyltransferase
MMMTVGAPNGSWKEFWENRAKAHGIRSVVNLGHGEDELDEVTQMQQRELYPLFLSSLGGNERSILDFGCGPGRFTLDLARMIGGRAIGVDPIQLYLDLAPRSEDVEYRLYDGRRIPLPDKSIDIVWVCLVLGGIAGRLLEESANEISRVLANDGLLFLVENTPEKPKGAAYLVKRVAKLRTLFRQKYWYVRSMGAYQALFSRFKLIAIGGYYDLGTRVSVLAGRKIN